MFLVLLGFIVSYSYGMVNPTVVTPTSYRALRKSGSSTLYEMVLPPSDNAYEANPYLLDLHGSRFQIGYDYAALLHKETSDLMTLFMNSMFSEEDQIILTVFIDYCWDSFLSEYTPQEYLDELAGMQQYHKEHGGDLATSDAVARRFYTLANMPADSQNIIAMLEQELEGDWPDWLKETVNEVIKLLEKYIHGCDAYGVWGPRTKGGFLYSSRNLDWNTNTGIDKYKLVTFYHITDPKYPQVSGVSSSLGFAAGLGALAGMSSSGLSVSEMNLDNSDVTFSGPPFPLRLRYILEYGKDLQSAISLWKSTNNTNSFNFLIGSASDALSKNNGAYALETMMGYSAIFAADSPVEKAATYFCPPKTCTGWTNKTGNIHIGKPLPNVVWRTNHGFDPRIMATQEPLFNDTVFRYDLMYKLFTDLEKKNVQIDDTTAVAIVATLGIKGKNFMSCDPANFPHGENVMSIAYAPGSRPSSKSGYLFISWEQGGSAWRPAACNPYVLVDFDHWV